MEGDSVHVAAQLEPLAEQGEVLMTEEGRSHRQVKYDCFLFTCQQRSLKKAVGDQHQGDGVACYAVQRVEASRSEPHASS